MTPLTKEQVQQSAMLVVESMQMVIGQNNNDLTAAEKENERLEARIVDLLEEIRALRNHIAERDTEIDNLTAALQTEQSKNNALQQITAGLNQENVQLKQRIARLESGRAQTVYPWKAE